MKKSEFVALLPLRGGSKGIPNKNIKDFYGQPLCFWALKALVSSKSIDKVFVSTDSKEIKKTIEQFNFQKVHFVERSLETSTDVASTESVMLEFAKKNDSKNIVLVQATNPFLTSNHLDEAIEVFKKNKLDSLLSVVHAHRFYWNADKKGTVKPLNYNPSKRPRRQDWDGNLVENGSFYITSHKSLMKSKCRLSGKMGAYTMPDYSYHELDSLSDWVIGESIFSQYQNSTNEIDFSKIKLLVTDVDGVLTDSGMYYSENSEETKKFHTRDGKGIELLKAKGIEVAIITSENTKILIKRAEKLKIKHLYQGVHDKLTCLNDLTKKLKLNLDEVAYIGDDINDTAALKSVGISFVPQDAVWENKKLATYVCQLAGGKGCVREACDLILNNKAK
jgi:YrbI family 3-deoxy-D-manno-octulosonate 8-phosphate phosphatase